VAGPRGVACIVNAICAHGGELMIHRNAPLPFLVCVCAMLIIPALRYGSATGPFSAVSKPPRALRDAVRSSRACGMSSVPSFPFPVRILTISLHSGRIVDFPTATGTASSRRLSTASEIPRGQVGRACMP
jgi:hypothetical protein